MKPIFCQIQTIVVQYAILFVFMVWFDNNTIIFYNYIIL